MKYEPYPWKTLKEPIIIGVDEVGRGCLAGPVYAAAALLDPAQSTDEFVDSKALTAKKREVLADKIKNNHNVCLGFASVEEIDEINILQASLLAMKRAVLALLKELGEKPGSHVHLLVDGNQRVPGLDEITQTPLVKGDFRAPPIGAASIVAKVTRDQLLMDLATQYPEYGFEKHKGYCTKDHKQAIEKWGPCPEHRKSFSGVKEFLGHS
ncbi:MAG: ribonuclease HII [Pseudobdellovibrionaceae bacterium]|nr:ribonuclease HII [Bdellovibrionales bacterium]USN48241.1 MAG: ribonuclease HII [Pseudobdellovibrionaceae bacterium]